MYWRSSEGPLVPGTSWHQTGHPQVTGQPRARCVCETQPGLCREVPRSGRGLCTSLLEAISGMFPSRYFIMAHILSRAEVTCCPEHCPEGVDSRPGILVSLGDFGESRFALLCL